MLKTNGGIYEKGDDWASFVTVDSKLATGQNPASSEEAAKKLLSLVSSAKEQGTSGSSFTDTFGVCANKEITCSQAARLAGSIAECGLEPMHRDIVAFHAA